MYQRTIFGYASAESPLNRVHPLVKFTLLFTFNLTALFLESPIPLLILMLTIISLYKIGRVPFKNVKAFILVVIIASQAVLISYLLGSSIEGNVTYIKYPWGTYVTEMTLLFAVTMILRYTCMLLGSALIFWTTSVTDILYGLATMRAPHSLIFVLTLSLRSTSIFVEDYKRVHDAMVLRGADFKKGSILDRTRTLANLFIALIVIALRRVMEIAYACEAKGISAPGKRTYLHRYPIGYREIIATIMLISIIVFAWVGRFQIGIFSFPGWPIKT